MSPDLACVALGASLPVAAVGWAAGAALDRAGVAPGQRHWLWQAAFWAAPLTVAAVLAAPRFPAEFTLRAALRGPASVPALWADASASPHGPPMTAIILVVLLAGAGLRLADLAWRLRRLRQVCSRARDLAPEAAGLPVRLTEDLDSPMLAGLWRPTILLPTRYGGAQAAEAAALVCRHEAAHARRGDNLRLLLEELALATLWFNPMLSAVRGRLSAAREEVCDAAALAGLDPRERRLYARSLLDCLGAPPSTLPAAGLIGLNRRSTTMRIDAILNPKPHRRRAALAGGLLAALAASTLAAVALAAPQAPAAHRPAAATWGPIDITADQVQVDKAHHVYRWTGNAKVSGITRQTMNGLYIDGRPASEADLPTLPRRRFASIKATFSPHELTRLDAQTKAGAN